MTEQDLQDYNEWLTEVWSEQTNIPFLQDTPTAYLEYRKKTLNIKNAVKPLHCKCRIPSLNYGLGHSNTCNKCSRPLQHKS